MFLLLTLFLIHVNNFILLLEFINVIINEEQIKITYYIRNSLSYRNILINMKQCLYGHINK